MTTAAALAVVRLIAYLSGIELIAPTIILGSFVVLFFLFFCFTAIAIALGFIIIAIKTIFKEYLLANIRH